MQDKSWVLFYSTNKISFTINTLESDMKKIKPETLTQQDISNLIHIPIRGLWLSWHWLWKMESIETKHFNTFETSYLEHRQSWRYRNSNWHFVNGLLITQSRQFMNLEIVTLCNLHNQVEISFNKLIELQDWTLCSWKGYTYVSFGLFLLLYGVSTS